ncbi:RNA 2',3'-cyclic phosphodiesterase [Oceanisphaera arctica]|uniref:RNA 2',3'-cyclic phosphodiesterase n=1 Tax=Oceanisphaera arctica TaxID=641510 RepID=A0A2P5TLU8_9GAMM|nr:RNA 2',3'-cyclic phosphodiesterase [Oceanisphaera arctica]PPL16319.1 2'-5' RNA ligase [Oceanisphaera arctica]GHA25303.1 RNA 2',3'-cyclic phosphodiesterase [Oceanisphaera arctica]
MDTSRLFLAFPADDQAPALSRLQDRLALAGRRIPASQFHLTLRFLGPLTPVQSGSLLKQLPKMRLPAFTLELDRLGSFPRAKVVWIGPSRVPFALSTLSDELAARCAALKLGPPHRAFRPHITLFRHDSTQELPPITPIRYRPSRLCLYSSTLSEQGPNYHILQSWPLTDSFN